MTTTPPPSSRNKGTGAGQDAVKTTQQQSRRWRWRAWCVRAWWGLDARKEKKKGVTPGVVVLHCHGFAADAAAAAQASAANSSRPVKGSGHVHG